MELDELKKSWNALDAQLQKEPMADEKQIKELIANYKTNTRHSLGRLVILQRFSLVTGAVGLAVILLVWFLLPTFGFNEHLQNKICLLYTSCCQELSHFLNRFTAPAGIIFQLVFTNLAYGEIA